MPRTFTPYEWLEELRCAYEQGDGEDQMVARVGVVGAWATDRARIAELEAEADRLRAQRDALVPLARYGCDMVNWRQGEGWLVAEKDTARAALAAIEAETTTTTEATDG